MSNLSHVSASSITLFSECARKWYYRYVLGHKSETTDAMRRGTQVHEQLESFLETGSLKDTTSVSSKIAASGLEHLTGIKVLSVEASLDEYPLRTDLGVGFKGFIDVLAETNEEECHIIDHKTTSDLRYAKKPAQLAENIQLVIYAKHIMDNSAYKAARLTHIYYTTRKPFESRRVDVVLTREEVEEAFAKVQDTVNQMLAAAERDMQSAERNINYCKAYNKLCEHYSDCFVSIAKKVSNPVSEKRMKLMSFLRGDDDIVNEILNPVEDRDIGEPDVGSTSEGAVGSTSEGAVGSTSEGAVGSTSEGAVGSTEGAVGSIWDAVGTGMQGIIAMMSGKATECHIYVGVVPVKGIAVSLLSVALQPLIYEVQRIHNVSAIAFVPYGRGWDTLRDLVMKYGIPNGHWYIDPDSQFYTLLRDALHAKAHNIFTAAADRK